MVGVNKNLCNTLRNYDDCQNDRNIIIGITLSCLPDALEFFKKTLAKVAKPSPKARKGKFDVMKPFFQ
jgi:hypothetical protein